MLEDVLVWVKHLIFPADFIVMDIEDDANIPLILGRPFMSIASCIVDKGKKQLEMGIEDQHINFDLFNEERKLLLSNPNFVRGPLLGGNNFHLTILRYLAPIIRQFVKFRDMPELKWKHRCIIK